MLETSQDRTTAVVAHAYAQRGWPVFPLEAGGKDPLTDRKAAPRGVYSASTDPGQIRSWWWRFAGANIGIACGGRSGPTVQDVDDLEHEDARSALAGIDKGTPCVRTPGDHHPPGRHFYFRGAHPNRDYPWGELRSTGLYVVAPPSVIDAGAYEWVVKPNGTVPELPSFLVPSPGDGAGAGVLEAPPIVPAGQRHPHLRDFAVRLARAGVLDERRMLAHLLLEYEQFCETDPPRKPGGIEAIAAWAVDSDIAHREQAYAEFVARWSRRA